MFPNQSLVIPLGPIIYDRGDGLDGALIWWCNETFSYSSFDASKLNKRSSKLFDSARLWSSTRGAHSVSCVSI